jgi:hypothetical protein
MKTQRYLDLNACVAGWFLARRSDQMTRMADQLFREVCADPVLEEYIVSLPLGGLPEIRRALSARATQPGQVVLEEVVHTAMKRDWRQLSPATIDRAANTYVYCLGRVLLQAAAMNSAGEHNVQTSALAQQVIGTQS